MIRLQQMWRTFTSRKWALYSALVVLAAEMLGSGVGCSPDSPLENVPDPGDVNCDVLESTYENFGARFFQDYCLRCHSLTLESDWDRTDAPQEIDFNTLGMAREFSDRIRLRAGALGDMPPRL